MSSQPIATHTPPRLTRVAAGEAVEDDLNDLAVMDDPGEERQDRGLVMGVGAWGISIVMHAIILVVMLFVVWAALQKETDTKVQITAIPVQPEPPPKDMKREIIETEVQIESEVVAEKAVVHELDLPVEELQTEDEVVAENPVKGREEADALSEMGGTGAFMTMGAGGGASGAFGNRNGGGRRRAVGAYGGSQASESAVEAALRWFVIHQSPNGQWDVDGYPANCQEQGPKCESGSLTQAMIGNGCDMFQADVGVTGTALLCFLGAGYDHRSPNRYQATVQKGLSWLLQQQNPQGVMGKRNYDHAIATMALAEAYAMTNDAQLREPGQRAVDIIKSRQAKDPQAPDPEYAGLAWDYIEPNPARLDASISGWNIMALKGAKAAGLDTGNALDGAKVWLERCWKASNPGWEGLDPYTGTSRFPYTWNCQGGQPAKPGPFPDRELSCVGLLCSIFLGHQSGDIMLETLANQVMQTQFPTAYPCNTYFMYYNTLGMFQVGGERFQKWNDTVRDMIIAAQRKDGCFNGSWEWAGTEFVGHQVGRLLSTAYCTLSLEVYYRYLPVAGRRR